MKIYKPSYLYIKTHNKTGLKYFGKTTQNPYTYQGSGTYWAQHIVENGYDVTTTLLNNNMPYDSEDDLIRDAVRFSIANNITESKEWANKRIENGDGGDTSMCENYIKGIANRDQTGSKNPMWGVESFAKGKTYEELYGEKATELRMQRAISATGRKLSNESLKKMSASISASTKGVPKSDQHRQNMKKPKSETHKKNLSGPRQNIKCSHCNLIGGISQMKRWHLDNCKKGK